MSGHSLYRTIALLLVTMGLRNIPFAGIALMPIEIALFEWLRKSELSCDRAGLLAGQVPLHAIAAEMKLAGGEAAFGGEGVADELSVEEFIDQAEEYEYNENVLDVALKYLNTVYSSHPFHTVRAAELRRWVTSGDYEKILRGDYIRRGDETDLGRDYGSAANYYKTQAKQMFGQVGEMIDKAKKRLRVRDDEESAT
jgi:hypothetical protein